jgi:type IV pilus assembly protein PilE
MNTPHCLQAKYIPPAQRGFTLIELMIVVAVVGILSAIAYPSYVNSVRKGARAEARGTLLEAAQFMERYYAANNRYDTGVTGAPNPTLPARLASVPNGAINPRYSISVAASATGYTLTATAQGTMSNDVCGNLTLTGTGVRGITGTGSTVQNCWR